MKANRILEMEKYITLKGTASIEELQRQFDVSANTVRRDIAELLQRGAAEKVYGGVRARPASQTLTPYELRQMSGGEAKELIGRTAAQLVRDGDVIFIDSGTTTLRMIDHLKDRRDVTIITHSLGAVIRALPYENLHVIVLPGSLRRKTNSMTGSDSVKAMKKYNIRTAFMAATGVSMHGATNSSAQEYDIKQAAVECSDRSILLVDRHKFGITGMMTYAPISSFEAVVTDEEPGEDYLNLLKENDVRLILPEEPAYQNKEGE